MFRTARTDPSRQATAGCWRHTAIVGEVSCTRCGARCCEHCWLEAPRGALCIDCALEHSGVRAKRHRVPPAVAPAAPLARMSWEESARLIDLDAASRRYRRAPVERPFFVDRAA